jgi:pimeloyl-ACP methyl ester carboxylesterase
MYPLLFGREYGSAHGAPLVILHGLFGSSRNWEGIAKGLAQRSRVWTLDLRNHGGSFHSQEHSLDAMVQDLALWQEEYARDGMRLLGHSMGGLVAMEFARRFAERVKGVVAVDIVPRPYDFSFAQEFAALSMDVSAYASRQEVEERLKDVVPEKGKRWFLMTNLKRINGKYHWQLNVNALERYKEKMGEQLQDLCQAELIYKGPSALVYGEKSPFVTEQDISLFRRKLPNCQIAQVAGAGHWLHYSHREAFLQQLLTLEVCGPCH